MQATPSPGECQCGQVGDAARTNARGECDGAAIARDATHAAWRSSARSRAKSRLLAPRPAGDTAGLHADTDIGAALAHALTARARGALDEAEVAARSVVDARPDDPRGWVLLGSLAHLRGALAPAAALYRRALAAAPDDPHAHAALAVALAQSGQPITAEAHFAAATRGGPGPWTALRTLRQARELATRSETAPLRAWQACATPLFEAGDSDMSARTDRPARGDMTEGTGRGAGRIAWTVADLAAALRERPRVVALTGAGISAASGLETRKQLWRRFTRDEAVSAVRFHADQRTLWTVIRAFWGDAAPGPNAAHLALARLPGLHTVITQNVDGLHQAAASGAGRVLELHGSLLRTRCIGCGRAGAPAPVLARGELPPRCEGCGAVLRPDVVLFGERVPAATLAAAAAAVADGGLLLVVGCAMDVSPASELPLLAAAAGATIVEIKRRASGLGQAVRVHHVAGAAEAVLPAVEELL